jgi:hypothetical protein
MQVSQDKFMKRLGEKARNKGLVYSSAALIAACTVLVLTAKKCQVPAPVKDVAPLCEPIKGDHICCESETYPYIRDANEKLVMKDGKPVPNPKYSLEDCHGSDNVCQDEAEPEKVLNAAGEPAGKIMDRFKDGMPITLPLEDEKSYDCAMEAVREAPCAERTEGGPEIDRPRITGDLVQRTIRQRTQAEIEEMRLHPESLQPGNNFYSVTLSAYEETCDATLPICTPEMVTACFCPNHVDCAPPKEPPPRTCGNGRIERGEQCDPRSRRPRNGCDEGSHCVSSCKCQKDARVIEPPEPEPPVAPPASVNCPAEITGRFRGRVGDTLTSGSAVSSARNAAGATGQAVKARVSISVRGGTGTVTGIGLSCQDCAGGSLSPGTVNLGGITVDPGMTCTTTVVVNIPPG